MLALFFFIVSYLEIHLFFIIKFQASNDPRQKMSKNLKLKKKCQVRIFYPLFIIQEAIPEEHIPTVFETTTKRKPDSLEENYMK